MGRRPEMAGAPYPGACVFVLTSQVDAGEVPLLPLSSQSPGGVGTMAQRVRIEQRFLEAMSYSDECICEYLVPSFPVGTGARRCDPDGVHPSTL